jgi:cation/acetate symporter
LNLPAFLMFVLVLGITLAITAWAARRTTTTGQFYAAGGTLSAVQNGFALAGDWMSAAAFLGFTGLVALYGIDGSLYAAGALVAFLAILMVVAEPVRNTGRYTLGDVIAYRMQRPTARLAAVVGTLVVNIAYMIPQLAGAGALIKLLLGIPYDIAVVLVGSGMIVYVAFGGMLATTWVQIVKAVLLLATASVMVGAILMLIGWNPATLFAAVEGRYGVQMLTPGNYLRHPLDPLSLGLSFVLGTAGLPHIMTRFYTVPDARTARKSIIWVMFLAGGFFMATTLLGLAAAHFVGQDAIRAADKGGNLALPLLAQHLGGGAASVGGPLCLAVVAAVAFATILAVVAGLTLSSSGAIAHDLYVHIIRHGHVDEKQQVRMARWSAVGVGIIAIVLGLLVQGQNVAVLVILAISIAASANFPIIVLALLWRRFNTGGVIGGVLSGLLAALALGLMGPAFMGKDALFPIVNPSIVSIPLGILGCIAGTWIGRGDRIACARFNAVMFRAQTGAGRDDD